MSIQSFILSWIEKFLAINKEFLIKLFIILYPSFAKSMTTIFHFDKKFAFNFDFNALKLVC